ncbi:hypothetical protein [Xenorhabdus japonica]|uniref:Uncharacterized protein n=1 Tax=Xenorhabdus japonica TaxID=53341 RepID=A0A1I5CFX6_9GAMM|nr:hypothetical protein [Xenorhabdus japonica]SFN85795.1 hypothetical protein SAMN05421579_12625 [Xenorhabdus japonica]SFN85925.1 hypothetical protein SAMN05421579_12632 [Xenorhabdus japonica]
MYYFEFSYPDGTVSENFILEKYRDFFMSYSENKYIWTKSHTTLASRYFSENRKIISTLFFSHHSEQGTFSLLYSHGSSGFYSLGDKDKMDQLIDLDGQLDLIFVGACIPPEKAFLAIEDFAKNPLEPSERIDWINAKDIDMTEKYRLLGLDDLEDLD